MVWHLGVRALEVIIRLNLGSTTLIQTKYVYFLRQHLLYFFRNIKYLSRHFTSLGYCLLAGCCWFLSSGRKRRRRCDAATAVTFPPTPLLPCVDPALWSLSLVTVQGEADRHVTLMTYCVRLSVRQERHCEGETGGRFMLSPPDRHPDHSSSSRTVTRTGISAGSKTPC